ncbi:3-deoxy-D-manno-octulosonic acid transferase [Bradyrhizobium sp.]
MILTIYDRILSIASLLYYHVTALRRGERKARLAWYRARKLPPQVSLSNQGSGAIWIHGVSAGEVKTAEKLAEAFRRLGINTKIVISSSTAAGYSRAAGIVEVDAAVVMPLDNRKPLMALFSQIRPAVLITIESEFWPNLFSLAQKHGVPVFVVNINLSKGSFRNFKRFDWFRRATILTVKHFYAQRPETRWRLLELGIPEDSVTVTGNMKLSPPTAEKVLRTQSLFTAGDASMKTVTFGNLHPEEMEGVKNVIHTLRSEVKDARIIIVPRHFAKFTPRQITTAFGLDIRIVRAASEILPSDRFIWFAAMGVLESVYANSNIAVVCGTFCHVGGHDLVEPMHLGAITLYGPNVERQTALHLEIFRRMPWAQVASFDQLSQSLRDLFRSNEMWNSRQIDLQDTLRQFSNITDRIAKEIAIELQLIR